MTCQWFHACTLQHSTAQPCCLWPHLPQFAAAAAGGARLPLVGWQGTLAVPATAGSELMLRCREKLGSDAGLAEGVPASHYP